MVAKASGDVAKPVPTLYGRVRETLSSAQASVARSVNTVQVLANGLVGCEVIGDGQRRNPRVEYGAKVLADLSACLLTIGKGYSVDSIEAFRLVCLEYPQLISESPSRKLHLAEVPAAEWRPGMLNTGLSRSHDRWLPRELRFLAPKGVKATDEETPIVATEAVPARRKKKGQE